MTRSFYVCFYLFMISNDMPAHYLHFINCVCDLMCYCCHLEVANGVTYWLWMNGCVAKTAVGKHVIWSLLWALWWMIWKQESLAGDIGTLCTNSWENQGHFKVILNFQLDSFLTTCCYCEIYFFAKTENESSPAPVTVWTWAAWMMTAVPLGRIFALHPCLLSCLHD